MVRRNRILFSSLIFLFIFVFEVSICVYLFLFEIRIPASTHVRPMHALMGEKRSQLADIESNWTSFEDYILHTVLICFFRQSITRSLSICLFSSVHCYVHFTFLLQVFQKPASTLPAPDGRQYVTSRDVVPSDWRFRPSDFPYEVRTNCFPLCLAIGIFVYYTGWIRTD